MFIFVSPHSALTRVWGAMINIGVPVGAQTEVVLCTTRG
jgi:hypothetical protein